MSMDVRDAFRPPVIPLFRVMHNEFRPVDKVRGECGKAYSVGFARVPLWASPAGR